MKKSLLLLLSIVLLISCNSIKRHNSQVNNPISVQKLKKDVDFAYQKLQKFQPALYWYISKEKLDFKFDSLKTTITKPLTSYEFYTKITPVLNEIRQGHLAVFPNSKMYSKKETKEIIKNEFKNKNYSFLFAIAKELEFLNNKKDASFIISQFEGDDYETGDLYWKSKTGKVSLIDDYYYDWYGYIDAELNTKELESLVSELNKKSTNSFDEWKKNVIKNNFNKINDLMGIKYMRDDNLKMAYVYFSKVSKSHYTNGLFNENPFYKIKGYMNFDKKQTYINLDKASVTLTLMNHLNLSKTIKNKNRDLHYFLAANCYYNMTYYGNSWMMKRISWSNNLAESNMIDEKEYYTCKQAKELYQKAFNLTKSKEFKALCAYMIAKCDARKNEYNLSQQYEKNYFIEQDVLEKLNEKSFRNFKAKYSNDYDEFISNCEIFSQYFNARR